jgi:hypothetical protein
MQFYLAPCIEEEETTFGFHCAPLRAATDEAGEHVLARVTAFVGPCVVLNPNGDVATLDVATLYEDLSQVRGAIGRLQKRAHWRSLAPAHLNRSSSSPAGASL